MNSKKLVILGFLTAIAVALQVFEATIPIPVQIPGGKLGIANIVTLVIMVLYGGGAAITVAAVRSVISSLIFGGIISGIYSVAGAVSSAVLSVILYNKCSRLSLVGIGVVSALTHNLFQVLVAVLIMKNVYVFTYYPVLMLIGIPSGVVTGMASGFVLKNNVIFKIKR